MKGGYRFLAVCAVGILMSFQSAFAATQAPTAARITVLYVGDETLWYIGTDTDVGGCGNPLMVLDTSLPHYKEVYSTLLAAYLAQKEVVFFYSDSCLYGGAHRVVKYIRLGG